MACVTQELSIVDTLSAAENIFLKSLPNSKNVILRRELDEQATHLLEKVGLGHIAPGTSAERLGLADQQLLELAKALATDCRLLLLDEPTSALTASQAAGLHETVKETAKNGAAVIYVSHRLDDVLDISDSIAILRDGQIVAAGPANAYSIPDVMQKMAGRKQEQFQAASKNSLRKVPTLDVAGIRTADLPHEISFTCHTGEIVGVAGLAGAGCSELLVALFGLQRLTAGSVSCVIKTGSIQIDNPSHAVRHGIGYLGEDRQTMGLLSGQPLLANITLSGLNAVSSRLGLIDQAKEKFAGIGLVDKLAIRCRGLQQNIDELSGGNQQKALIAALQFECFIARPTNPRRRRRYEERDL